MQRMWCRVMVVLGLTVALANPLLFDNVRLCIRNCSQCRKMYGKIFQGRVCVDECFSTNGIPYFDCVDVFTIRKFLRLTRLFTQNEFDNDGVD